MAIGEATTDTASAADRIRVLAYAGVSVAFFSASFAHLAAAAFLAISDRRAAESLSLRALPPLRPPLRPNATAAGSLTGRLIRGVRLNRGLLDSCAVWATPGSLERRWVDMDPMVPYAITGTRLWSALWPARPRRHR